MNARDLSRKTVAAFSLLLIGACSSVRVDTITKDGVECHASRTALFMSAEAISGEVCGGKLGANGSGADVEALSAAISSAVSAAVGAVMPQGK